MNYLKLFICMITMIFLTILVQIIHLINRGVNLLHKWLHNASKFFAIKSNRIIRRMEKA